MPRVAFWSWQHDLVLAEDHGGPLMIDPNTFASTSTMSVSLRKHHRHKFSVPAEEVIGRAVGKFTSILVIVDSRRRTSFRPLSTASSKFLPRVCQLVQSGMGRVSNTEEGWHKLLNGSECQHRFEEWPDPPQAA